LGQRPKKQQVTHIIQPEGLKEIKALQAFTKIIGLSLGRCPKLKSLSPSGSYYVITLRRISNPMILAQDFDLS